MTPLDMDEVANIGASRMYRMKVCMTPVERRAQALFDTGRYTHEEAERIAYETMEREPCRN